MSIDADFRTTGECIRLAEKHGLLLSENTGRIEVILPSRGSPFASSDIFGVYTFLRGYDYALENADRATPSD